MYFETYSKDLAVRAMLKATVLKLNIELPKQPGQNDKHLYIMFSLNDFSVLSHSMKFEAIPEKGFEVDVLSLSLDSVFLKSLFLCLKKNENDFDNIKIYNELLKIVTETKEITGG
ncbi:MAG: hypothetical protein ACRCXX_13695 [Cetobacterium sp.]|uniref:hypothetical protein n=1 Tax=Cetobacterium sp. TaxID=2071632 RepID=UPI003F322A84